MKKILLLLFIVAASFNTFAQTNAMVKGIVSFNTDSATFKSTVNSTQAQYGNIGALYYNKQIGQGKWRIFYDSVWHDLIRNTTAGLITASNGLTATGSNVKLGGVLTETTTLSGDSLILSGSRVRFTDNFVNGMGKKQWTLTQKATPATFPVGTFKPSTQNTNNYFAFDVFPSGPTEPTTDFSGNIGISWIDICNKDLITNPSAATTYLHLAARATDNQIASQVLNAGVLKPLNLAIGTTTYFSLNTSGRIQAPFYTALDDQASGALLNTKYTFVGSGGGVFYQVPADKLKVTNPVSLVDTNLIDALASGKNYAAGSDRQIQINNAGAIGASSEFVFNASNDLSIGNQAGTTFLSTLSDFNLVLDNAAGNFGISISSAGTEPNIQSAGGLAITNTTSGDLFVSNAHGDIDIHAGETVTGQLVNLRNVSGDINILTGESTGAGNINITATNGNVIVQSTASDITIQSGGGSGDDITIETGSNTGTLKINSGTNEQLGTSTLVAGTVVVSNTKITANSKIFFSVDVATNPGFLTYTRSPGTGFTIVSSSGTDVSVVTWWIVEPN